MVPDGPIPAIPVPSRGPVLSMGFLREPARGRARYIDRDRCTGRFLLIHPTPERAE